MVHCPIEPNTIYIKYVTSIYSNKEEFFYEKDRHYIQNGIEKNIGRKNIIRALIITYFYYQIVVTLVII